MKTDMTIDVTNGCFEARVAPKTTYSQSCLMLKSDGEEIGIQLTDEQLEEIRYVIERHLNRHRSHEYPDQQRILVHELHTAVEELSA